MKRTIAVLLAACVFLTAAGCRGTGDKPADGLAGMTAGGQESIVVTEDGTHWCSSCDCQSCRCMGISSPNITRTEST